MVRIFKNMRNMMIEKKVLAEGVAPSSVIRCACCSRIGHSRIAHLPRRRSASAIADRHDAERSRRGFRARGYDEAAGRARRYDNVPPNPGIADRATAGENELGAILIRIEGFP
jgi:hypothetical protein